MLHNFSLNVCPLWPPAGPWIPIWKPWVRGGKCERLTGHWRASGGAWASSPSAPAPDEGYGGTARRSGRNLQCCTDPEKPTASLMDRGTSVCDSHGEKWFSSGFMALNHVCETLLYSIYPVTSAWKMQKCLALRNQLQQTMLDRCTVFWSLPQLLLAVSFCPSSTSAVSHRSNASLLKSFVWADLGAAHGHMERIKADGRASTRQPQLTSDVTSRSTLHTFP